jgi:DNA-directed RNA polymerase specialized sigma subunit
VDELTAAVQAAIAALESDTDERPTDQEIADRLREAL